MVDIVINNESDKELTISATTNDTGGKDIVLEVEYDN